MTDFTKIDQLLYVILMPVIESKDGQGIAGQDIQLWGQSKFGLPS
jgi:hypothetical protein